MNKHEADLAGLRNTLDFIVREIDKRVDFIVRGYNVKKESEGLELDLDAYQQMKILSHEFNVDTSIYDSKLEKSIRRLKDGRS